ncbi:MAG: PaaI family thioesterase [Syntrophobacteraceae bacterium]
MMNSNLKYKLIPVRDNDMCFGCGPINPYGLRMKFFTDEKSIISELTVADYLAGWKNVVHGGIVTVIFDEVMGRTAMYFLKKVCLTKNISVNFLRTTSTAKKLKAEGRILEVRSEREAVMEASITDEDGNVCATATSTWALYDPAVALELGKVDQDALESLEPIFNA